MTERRTAAQAGSILAAPTPLQPQLTRNTVKPVAKACVECHTQRLNLASCCGSMVATTDGDNWRSNCRAQVAHDIAGIHHGSAAAAVTALNVGTVSSCCYTVGAAAATLKVPAAMQ